MKRLLLTFLLFSSVGCFAPAQDYAPEAPEPQRDNIRVELQIVAVPERLAFPLVADLMAREKAEAAYQEIQKLLVAGTAKLIGWPMLITHSRQASDISATREVRYPTRYDSGGVSVYMEAKDGELSKEIREIQGVELNAVPNEFEVRNTGVTLQVDPALSADKQSIELSMVTEHTRLVEMKKVMVERVKTGEKMAVEQPVFDVNRIANSLTVKSGERKLLSVSKTSEPADHLQLYILKAELLKNE